MQTAQSSTVEQFLSSGDRQEFSMQSIFHLAMHVRDLQVTRQFYGDLLGCEEGRSTDTWVDFNFFGHQLSLHLGEPFAVSNTGKVGKHNVPMPHLGVILEMSDWHVLKDRLIEAQMEFVLPPSLRFAGEPGEQATMFFLDPAGNPIEIKGFTDLQGIYAQF
jgi:extradiol dioxygenase family protein